jgi:hypothetical protein
MNDLFKKLFRLNTSGIHFVPQAKPTRHELIYQESEIGGRLFGPMPVGHYRQFFNLDRYTWVLYEEWQDDEGITQSTTISYEVRENGILKVEEGKRYYYIEGDELTNLVAAIHRYYQEVSREIYHRDPATGKLLTVA